MKLKKTLNALKFAGLVGLLSLIPTKAKGQNLKLEDFQTTVPQKNELVYYVANPEIPLAPFIPKSEIPSPILSGPRYATQPAQLTNFPDLQFALDKTSTTQPRRFLIYPGRYEIGVDTDLPSSITLVGMTSSLIKDKYETTSDIPTTKTALNGTIYTRNKENIKLVNLYFDGLPNKTSLVSFVSTANSLSFNNIFKGRFPQGIESSYPNQGLNITLSKDFSIENNLFSDLYRIMSSTIGGGPAINCATNLNTQYKVKLRKNIIARSSMAVLADNSPSLDFGSDVDFGNNVFVNNINQNLKLKKPSEGNYDVIAQRNTWFGTLKSKGITNEFFSKLSPTEIEDIIKSQIIDSPLTKLEDIVKTIDAPEFVVPASKTGKPLNANQSYLYVVPYNLYDPLKRIGLIPASNKKWWRMYE